MTPQPLIVVVRTLLVVMAVAGCSSATAPPAPSDQVATTPTAAPAQTAGPPPETSPAPTDGPPVAALSAEGGDPVAGQLGSYTWGDEGSDSPWLAGAPVSVGTGEPLSLTFDPGVAVESWRARSVPSSAGGPDGASLIGEGASTLTFTAPPAGSWTVEIRVVFAERAGDASYFWLLDVS